MLCFDFVCVVLCFQLLGNICRGGSCKFERLVNISSQFLFRKLMPRDAEGDVVRKGELSPGKNKLEALNSVDGKIPADSDIFFRLHVALAASGNYVCCYLGFTKAKIILEHVGLGRRHLSTRMMLFPVGSS